MSNTKRVDKICAINNFLKRDFRSYVLESIDEKNKLINEIKMLKEQVRVLNKLAYKYVELTDTSTHYVQLRNTP